MAAFVYLDSEDEITSAASRIRSAREDRVVLVLPYGSRVATSRINFRLLAREAATAHRRLDIVAPDASTRALAASAGLAAFASVTEAEEAQAVPQEAPLGAEVAAGGPTPAGGAGAAGVRSSAGAGLRAGGATAGSPGGLRTREDPAPASGGAPRGTDEGRGRGRTERVDRGPGRGRSRIGRLILLGVLALVAGIGGYAAWTMLPAADITLTPRVSPVGPVSITVKADPAATTVDMVGLVIPATPLEIPVSVSGEFKATGKKVLETSAAGEIRFDSINTVFDVSVPKGTRVSTLDGIVFSTTSAVIVPRATVNGTTIRHGFATIGIDAVKAGTAANVAAGTITQAPDTLGTQQVSVSNPAATTGGTRTETPLVIRADVDAAMASLTKDIGAAFAAALAAPQGVPAGATVFAATAVPGQPTPDPSPGSLVGKEVATFSLGLAATGSVLAVDPAPVRMIAETRLTAAIDDGHTLLPGSVSVSVGEGTVAEGIVSFEARAAASQVAKFDAAALRRNVLGMPRAQAEALLGQYGEVRVGLWPDWATDVPANDGRVTLTVLPPTAGLGSPAPSGSAAPGSSPSGTPGS